MSTHDRNDPTLTILILVAVIAAVITAGLGIAMELSRRANP